MYKRKKMSELKDLIYKKQKEWQGHDKCGNCLLTDKYRFIEFDKDGTCNYCTGYDQVKKEVDAIKSEETFLKILEENKAGEGSEYDCVVGLSGGKDSTYLTYLMKEKFGLRTLALTVDTPFLPDVAKENIDQTVKAIGVDHVYIPVPVESFVNMYKQLFRLGTEHGTEFDVCNSCGEYLRRSLAEIAIEKKIPLTMVGLDHFQIIDWEVLDNPPMTSEHEYWKIMFEKAGLFEDVFKVPNFKPDGFIPKECYPFAYLPYDAEEVTQAVEDLNISRETHPDQTNCYLTWLIEALDILRLGFPTFSTLDSSDIRDKKEEKEEGGRVIKNVFNRYANGDFDKQIDHCLEMLGDDLESILKETGKGPLVWIPDWEYWEGRDE